MHAYIYREVEFQSKSKATGESLFGAVAKSSDAHLACGHVLMYKCCSSVLCRFACFAVSAIQLIRKYCFPDQ